MTTEGKLNYFSYLRNVSVGLVFFTVLFAIILGFTYVERWPTFLEMLFLALLCLTLTVIMWTLWSIKPERIITELNDGLVFCRLKNIQTGHIISLLEANLNLPQEQANVMWDRFIDLEHDYDDKLFSQIRLAMQPLIIQALHTRSKERRFALARSLQAMLVSENCIKPIPAHIYEGYSQQASQLESFEAELRK